ncbi:multiple sugar transport system permease protein [Deinobacterium chartae]|uniref:Multiple sugar transport system permease protein n=1 Tax=Deinobacterium chartae TaxID=521158 RepID=A0A841HTW5_9DEIO|nr:multiple sugar transport system permease protein [Deinobacterium chartae]
MTRALTPRKRPNPLVDAEHPARPTPLGSVVMIAILTVLALLTLIPLYWMFSTAFTSSALTVKFPPELFPSEPTLQNFREIVQRENFWRWVWNTTVLAVVVTVFELLLASMAGYAFAKIPFAGRTPLFWAYIVAMMLPFQVILVPLFIMSSKLGMIDSYAGLILPALASPYSVFLMKQFIQTLPSELIDAARVDGAHEFKIFWSIILPLIKPGLAFLGIITFIAQWNSFLWPLIITRSAEMRTLQVGLVLLREEVPLSYGLHMAGAVLAALPIIAVFFASQKYFLRGVTVGAVKG